MKWVYTLGFPPENVGVSIECLKCLYLVFFASWKENEHTLCKYWAHTHLKTIDIVRI